MRTEAVLFDLDGTLLDSLADIGESMNFVLSAMGLPEHSLSDYRAFVGDGVTMLARRALPSDRRGDADVADCVGRFREIYGARASSRTAPYDGIADLLDELTRRGIVMAVLSNKPHDLTRRLVAELLGRWRFAAVFGERSGVPRKPDPTGALEAAACLRTDPARILYVGDTPTDMATAHSAGMQAAGAAWGFRSEEELRAAGAAHIVRQPRDVLALLEA